VHMPEESRAQALNTCWMAVGVSMSVAALAFALIGAPLYAHWNEDGEPAEGRQQRWEKRIAPWADMVREFREEGFYERFAAKGEVERVARIQRDLARAAGIEIKKG